jgi:hypothetical protein
MLWSSTLETREKVAIHCSFHITFLRRLGSIDALNTGSQNTYSTGNKHTITPACAQQRSYEIPIMSSCIEEEKILFR